MADIPPTIITTSLTTIIIALLAFIIFNKTKKRRQKKKIINKMLLAFDYKREEPEKSIEILKNALKEGKELLSKKEISFIEKEIKNLNKLVLIKETGAPNFYTALKLKEMGSDYKEFQKLKKEQAKTLEENGIINETGGTTLEEAIEVVEKGFPDYKTYIKAKKEGYETYQQYMQPIEDRNQLLKELASKREQITIQELMQKMNFKTREEALEWIYSLPEDTIYIDGENIVFQKQVTIDESVIGEIDQLMKKYEDIEKTKKGKI